MVTVGMGGGVRVSVGRGWPLKKVSAKLKKNGGPKGQAASETPCPLSYELCARHLTEAGGIERRNQDASGNKSTQG